MTIDHDYMRRKNLGLIFDAMRQSDELHTKRELQKKTDLAWTTVCKSINELETKQFIAEVCGADAANAGRPAKKYDISAKKNLIMGIDINVDSIQAVVADIRCRVLYDKCSMIFEPERDNILSLAKAMIHDMLKAFGDDKSMFLGVGFSLMSVVDAEKGIAVYSQHIRNWENVDIRRIFEDEFGLPVLVEHDPSCYAIAEMNIGIGRRRKYKNISFFRIYFGIGMSMIIDGEIYKGQNKNSGEFGHMCMDASGPRCACGKRGCVEAYASISGIAARYREEASNVPGYNGASARSADSDMAIMNKIAKAAKNGDETAKSYFDKAAEMLGLSLGNFITLMNPDIVIIGGMFAEYAPLYIDKALEIVDNTRWPYSKTEIALSTLGNNAAALGAAALFIQKKAWEDIF